MALVGTPQQASASHARPAPRAQAAAVFVVLAALLAVLLPAHDVHAQTPPFNRGINRACSATAKGFDPFGDTSGGTHVPAVNCIAFFGVTQGRPVSGGYVFDPLSPVSREQMASFIARTMNRVDGFRLPVSAPRGFADSTGEHRRNIDRLARVGIVEGGRDGRFHRHNAVTREQMASFVARAIEHVTGSTLPMTDVFRGAGMASAHDDNVAKLAAIGVVQGRSARVFGPTMRITRQEMASFLARALDYLVGRGYGLSPQTPEFRQVVGRFQTPLTPGEPRNQNIRRAADLIQGAQLRPGEQFSLDRAIGPRTRARGFNPNGFISGGDLVSTVGGGVSQVATTFFNAAWYAGIRLVRHQPHSIYFTRYPPGRESTINWRTIDVVVVNDTPFPMSVRTSHSTTSVTIELIGTPWAKVTETYSGPTHPRTGQAFTASYSRTVTYPDGSRATDSFRHTYRAM